MLKSDTILNISMFNIYKNKNHELRDIHSKAFIDEKNYYEHSQKIIKNRTLLFDKIAEIHPFIKHPLYWFPININDYVYKVNRLQDVIFEETTEQYIEDWINVQKNFYELINSLVNLKFLEVINSNFKNMTIKPNTILTYDNLKKSLIALQTTNDTTILINNGTTPELIDETFYIKDVENIEHIVNTIKAPDIEKEISLEVLKVYDFEEYLKRSISSRYTIENETDRVKEVIDCTLPSVIIKHKANIRKIKQLELIKKELNIQPKNYSSRYCISEWAANILNAKQIPIEHLIGLLGYSKENIIKLIDKVQKQNLNVVFIGAGGTCMNTAYWLSKLLLLSKKHYIFENTTVLDDDDIELSNMLRFPFDPMTQTTTFNGSTKKINVIANFISDITRNKIKKEEKRITEEILLKNEVSIKLFDDTIENSNSFILYGAPDLATRDMIYNTLQVKNNTNTYAFICATHAENSCSLVINPKQLLDIQLESYGLIHLNSFFMNQLRLAIGFLEILANNSLEDLNKKRDEEVLDYTFSLIDKKSTTPFYNFKFKKTNTIGEI